MNPRNDPPGDDTDEYWRLFAIALFLLLPVDLLTTLVATRRYGIGIEANPIMRWFLSRGPLPVALVNLAVAFLAIALFAVLMRIVRQASPPYGPALERGVEAWLGLLIAVGLFVLVNNLAVIFHGESLL